MNRLTPEFPGADVYRGFWGRSSAGAKLREPSRRQKHDTAPNRFISALKQGQFDEFFAGNGQALRIEEA
jgi:hypothetical protein